MQASTRYNLHKNCEMKSRVIKCWNWTCISCMLSMPENSFLLKTFVIAYDMWTKHYMSSKYIFSVLKPCDRRWGETYLTFMRAKIEQYWSCSNHGFHFVWTWTFDTGCFMNCVYSVTCVCSVMSICHSWHVFSKQGFINGLHRVINMLEQILHSIPRTPFMVC